MEHGHPWTEIKSCTLSQLGLFVREATKLDDVKRKETITAAWLGFNADYKNLKKILNSSQSTHDSEKTDAEKAADHKKNWFGLAAALRGVR